ncbi:hypothetical protein KJ671_02175 [Patescibacteria group bacterium]|nr:hypothetical protein [Patescibacteria group bacterium]
MNSILKLLTIALLLTIVISVFYIFSDNNKDLNISLIAPDEIMVGVPFDLKAEFSNQLNSVLKDASLIITLPEGAVFIGSEEGKKVESKDLGDIGTGSLISENYKVVFLNGSNENCEIGVLVSYYSSSSKYEKEEKKSIKILNNGINITFDAPEQVFNGEEFEIKINYKNVSELDFYGLGLDIEYPANFTFISSDYKPDTGNNVWDLGDLRSESEGDFIIKGSVIGPDNSPVVFKFSLKIDLGNKEYYLNLNDVELVISPSPLSIAILLNNEQEYVAKTEDTLRYVISYVNNTNVPLKNSVVRAYLSGELFDLTSLDSKSIFRSSDDSLIWNSSNSPELNYIAPRSAGFVSFTIDTKDRYPTRRLGDKDYSLNIRVEIESPTVPEFLDVDKTYNTSKLETKVSGSLSLETTAYFRDAQSGILNSGALPPRVGEPTNFTIHWILNSLASDFANIEIKAFLEEGVEFTGTAKSNFGNIPILNEETNEIIWALDKLPANKGFIDSPAEAIFQIKAIPSSEQIANYMKLIGETSMKAIDAFTSEEIGLKLSPVTTALPDDLTIGQQGGVVQP